MVPRKWKVQGILNVSWVNTCRWRTSNQVSLIKTTLYNSYGYVLFYLYSKLYIDMDCFMAYAITLLDGGLAFRAIPVRVANNW